MELISVKNDTVMSGFGGINLPLTLDCGQAFRWKETEKGKFTGISKGYETVISSDGETITFHNTSKEEAELIWADYFDTVTDYPSVIKKLSEDEKVAFAVQQYGIIRILNQDPWETLCSFIISACNNIPRIKGIVERLCTGFGEERKYGFTFPSAELLAAKTAEDLAFLRSGYRAPYIIDAARKVASGEIDLEKIKKMDEKSAEKELMKISGVGKKVADCTMLFSLGFGDTYPVDRHIARANALLYPDGLPDCFNGHKGLAQQYIFHYQRTENPI